MRTMLQARPFVLLPHGRGGIVKSPQKWANCWGTLPIRTSFVCTETRSFVAANKDAIGATYEKQDWCLGEIFMDTHALEGLHLLLETITLAAAIIAIPWVSYAFLRDLSERRRERAARVYAAVDQSFRDNLAIALAYPRLEGGEFEHPDGPPELSGDEHLQQCILFDIITSGFEICYLTFVENRDDPKFERQWKAWRGYMLRHCRKHAYRRWLENIGVPDTPDADHLYDPEFNAVLREMYHQSAPPL